jgi:hypothetical protein
VTFWAFRTAFGAGTREGRKRLGCDACYDESLGIVWDYTNEEIMMENVHAMI